jgi:hypothetical protein
MPNTVIANWPLQPSPESGFTPFSYVTGSWQYGMSQVAQVAVTNPTPAQSKSGLLRGARVELQLSNNNGLSFQTVGSWWSGIEPGRAYVKSWWLGDYANAPDFNQCRLVFYGAIGATVNISGYYDGGTSSGVVPMLALLPCSIPRCDLERDAA